MSGERAELHRVARELRQRVELNRLAGWEMPLRLEREAPDGARPLPVAAEDSGASRDARLDALRQEVVGCTRCRLHAGRTQTVFGVGNPAARLLFVGEAPGFDEDRLGEPFVGKAGQLLNDMIRAMGLRREDVYIANVVKCRPPDNRTPAPDESGTCLEYLKRQIEIVEPEALVALGLVAARALLGGERPLGQMRNQFHDYAGIAVMPTYHPAYLLRNPQDKRKTWEDLQLVMARLGLRRR